MSTTVRELLDEAAISDVPASLGSDVVAGARRRRRHRVIAATAGVAATAVVLAVVTPSVLQRRQVDVVQPSPGQSAVVPRLIPPLGDHLPWLDDREVDRVSVAWTTADPHPTSPDSVRLLALDARDGQPVVLAHQVSAASPVAVSPDGRAVAYVTQDCSGVDHQSLGLVLLAEPLTSSMLGQCDLPMRQTTGPSMVAAPAFAWSADGSKLAAVVDRPQGRRVVVYRVGDSAAATGGMRTVFGSAVGVAWAPGGVAVRRLDGSWALVSLADGAVTALPDQVDGASAQALAWSPDGRTWAKARWGSRSTWGYQISPWPADDRVTTGGFRQALTAGDRWLVASGPARFLALAGPFGNAVGRDGGGLGAPEDTALPRVLQAVSGSSDRGLPVSLLAFSGDQTVRSVGVAGDLMVDPTFIATVPDDGHAWWESRLVWLALACLIVTGAVVGLVSRARRRPLRTPTPS